MRKSASEKRVGADGAWAREEGWIGLDKLGVVCVCVCVVEDSTCQYGCYYIVGITASEEDPGLQSLNQYQNHSRPTQNDPCSLRAP